MEFLEDQVGSGQGFDGDVVRLQDATKDEGTE
jgi:hypothetical protein